MPPDSLPDFARDLPRNPADTTAQPAGVIGSGFRVAAAVERSAAWMDLPGLVTLSVELSADLTTFTTASYDGRKRRLPDTGAGIIPRFAVMLRWSPQAPQAHGNVAARYKIE